MGCVIQNERGIAMLTVMMLMLMLTVLGIAAITVSGLENNMAGTQRTTEAAAIAAESCIATSANIIRQTIDEGSVPAVFTGGNPVPNNSATPVSGASLADELIGRSDSDADSPTSDPDVNMGTVGAFSVTGDIDRIYARTKAGSAIMFASGYEGTGAGAGGGGVEIMYRIDCVASNVATGTSSRIVAVYACTHTGETCQKKI